MSTDVVERTRAPYRIGPGQDPVQRPSEGVVLIEWLAAVWAPLAAYTFALATGYWFEFRHVYAIPVSFASGSTIAALPALAGIVLAMCAAGLVVTLVPSAALWKPVGPGHRRLIDAHEQGPKKEALWRWFASVNLARVWVAVNATFAACVLVAFFVLPSIGVSRWAVQVSGIVLPTVAGLLALQPVRTRAGITGMPAAGFNAFLVWILLVQWLIVTYGARMAIDVAQTDPWWLAALVAIDAAFMAVGVFSVQFFFALGAPVRWRGMTARGALVGVLALASMPLAVPALGARLAAIPLAVNGPDGDACVVLVASSKAVMADWVDVAATPAQSPTVSRPLPFATLLDSYFVKLAPGASTIAIPADQVRRIDACPPANPPLREGRGSVD